ncbi:MAG: DUF4369 domain-containing protein [Candidatus Cryptobacteroides sp.]
MKNYRYFLQTAALCAVLCFASCSRNASVRGTLQQAPDSDVIVRLLDINRYETIDTVKTGPDGSFKFKVKVAGGDPEFVYLFYSDKKIASLLLDRGDRVSVDADTLGHYSVEGSQESVRLMEVERSLSDFSREFIALSDALEAAGDGTAEAAELRRELAQSYIRYYRDRTKFVMENSHSLTVVPVLYQTIAPGFPLFGQPTDAIHFRNISDSLSTVYPDSKYVRALRQEAEKRFRLLELNSKIQNTEPVDFLDIELPDVKGEKKKLSDLKGKAVLVHFWTASNAAQKMFNQDVLKPVYSDFHSKGLEIYQVALDSDKAEWARTVRNQGLDWVNVCDSRAAASPYVGSYNLASLPVSYLLVNGAFSTEKVTDEASLRRVLGRILK